MQTRSLAWLGVRTEQFAAMRHLFTDVMGLETTREAPGLLGLRLADGTEMELYGPDDDFHDFFITGPVVAFLVDDVDRARAEMEAMRHRLHRRHPALRHEQLEPFPRPGWYYIRDHQSRRMNG
ncbi:MAG: VOC family protein [Thermomicrobiales bacterium]